MSMLVKQKSDSPFPLTETGACNQPRNSVSVCCDEESGTPGGLHQPPLDDGIGFDDKTLGSMHVWHPPLRKPVPLVARVVWWWRNSCCLVVVMEQVRPGMWVLLQRIFVLTCSNSNHCLFPQVDPSTFDDLVERVCTHVNNDCARNGMTATTTQVGTTTNTMCLDESCSLFWSVQLPENLYNTPYLRGASHFFAGGHGTSLPDGGYQWGRGGSVIGWTHCLPMKRG